MQHRLRPALVGVKAGERDKFLTYFETNAHRMNCRHFRDLRMFVGSRLVEAGCKAVIGLRLKLSGMRWTIPGATGILTPAHPPCQRHLRPHLETTHNQTTAA